MLDFRNHINEPGPYPKNNSKGESNESHFFKTNKHRSVITHDSVS